MNIYDQHKNNELLRDIRDGEMGKREDRLYSILKSTLSVAIVFSVMVYCFVGALTP